MHTIEINIVERSLYW